MNKFAKLAFLLCLIMFVEAKRTYIIVDEVLKECEGSVPKNDLFDYSNMQIIPENDTHTFLNGSLRFLREVSDSWHLHLYTEHYERGKFLPQAYVQDIADYCKEIHNPIQPWYYATKDLKGCPVPKDHVYELKMVPIEFPKATLALLPNHYEGRWRLIINGIFNSQGVESHECKMGFGNLYIE